jgi:hypothetical protein
VNPTAPVIAAIKDLLAGANPGLVTKQDLERLEQRLGELEELVDELATRLGYSEPEAEGTADPSASAAAENGDHDGGPGAARRTDDDED